MSEEPRSEADASSVVPSERDGRRMSPLRWIAVGCFVVALLAALVPIVGLAGSSQPEEQRTAAEQTTTTEKPTTTTTTTTKPKASKPKPKQTGEPAGEVDAIDEDAKERANAEKQKNKLILAGVAAALLGIVIWGRRARTGRRRKISDQAKGK